MSIHETPSGLLNLPDLVAFIPGQRPKIFTPFGAPATSWSPAGPSPVRISPIGGVVTGRAWGVALLGMVWDPTLRRLAGSEETERRRGEGGEVSRGKRASRSPESSRGATRG
jgi:hypothetical protein